MYFWFKAFSMNKFLLFLPVLFVFAHDTLSQTLFWSPEINVSNNTYGSVRPRIAITTGNIPVVMWGGGTGSQPLWAARGNGAGFNMPIRITPLNVDPFVDSWAGANIAANGNTVFVVFKRQPEMTKSIYAVKSADGGVTWGDTTLVDNVYTPFTRFGNVEVTSSGNPVIVYMTFDSNWGSPEYVVTTSTDGGMTYPTPVPVSSLGGSEVCDCCPAHLIVDGNTQIITWRRNNMNLRDMWMGMSSDGGLTFAAGADVDNTNWIVPQCPSSGPDPFLNGDSLHTVFMSEGLGDRRVYISSYNINTSQMGLMTALAPNVPSTTDQNYPQIAGLGDTIGVVWQQTDGSGNTDVFFSWSVTGATGLINSEMILNNITSGMQRCVDLAYSNRVFHFVFQDFSSNNVIYKYASFSGVGVNEDLSPQNDLKIFPNPSDGNVIVSYASISDPVCSITVKDITGKIVFASSSHYSIPRQVGGVYLVEVTTESGNRIVKRMVWE